jgi:hypothetical protein
MPHPPRPLATALVTLAGAVLLTGCTGQDQTKTTTTQAPVTTTSSAAGTSGNAEAAAFCAQAVPLFSQVGNTLSAAGQDPTALKSGLQQAVDAFDTIHPPTAIAQDWATSRDGFAALRDTVAAIDPAAPDAQAKVQAAEQQTETQIGAAFSKVTAYAEQNCATAGASTSAPTS